MVFNIPKLYIFTLSKPLAFPFVTLSITQKVLPGKQLLKWVKRLPLPLLGSLFLVDFEQTSFSQIPFSLEHLECACFYFLLPPKGQRAEAGRGSMTQCDDLWMEKLERGGLGSGIGLFSTFKGGVLCSKRRLIFPAKERIMLFENLFNVRQLQVKTICVWSDRLKGLTSVLLGKMVLAPWQPERLGALRVCGSQHMIQPFVCHGPPGATFPCCLLLKCVHQNCAPWRVPSARSRNPKFQPQLCVLPEVVSCPTLGSFPSAEGRLQHPACRAGMRIR